MKLNDLPTPSLILDKATVERNTARMAKRMTDMGVSLRPHLKTAKSAQVARLATRGHSGGVTVSTLAEAAYFLGQGLTDFTYAIGIVPSKLDMAAALMDRGADLTLLTDNLDVVRPIAARPGKHVFRLLIEVDCGDARGGLLPDDPMIVEIGRAIHTAANMELAGVLTHGGHSYGATDLDGVRAIAEEERAAVVQAADALRAAGLPCPVVSAGSTPTALWGESFEGVTEMRPGVYTLLDLDQYSRGVCAREDLALSVLASVIGHNRHVGHILLDAGALAMSKDISAHARRPEVGYGEVCDADTLAPLPGLYVAKVSQEHGFVPVADATLFDRLPVGSKVRVLPNHACITAAAYRHYNVLENGAITETWDRINGWDLAT